MFRLIQEYEDIAEKIKLVFKEYMWGYDYSDYGYWIAQEIGGIYDFSDGEYLASLQDMVEVLKNKYPPKVVEAHYEYSINYSGEEREYAINLKNFVKLYNGEDVKNFSEIYHDKIDKQRAYWESPEGKKETEKQMEEQMEAMKKYLNGIK